jgi:hypothetical protein
MHMHRANATTTNAANLANLGVEERIQSRHIKEDEENGRTECQCNIIGWQRVRRQDA